MSLTLTARQAGALANVVTARADGGLTDSARQTVTVKQAAGEPAQHRARRGATSAGRRTGRSSWRTRGEVPLANVVVRDALPPELTFQSASDGGTPQGNQVTWPVGTLDARREEAADGDDGVQGADAASDRRWPA